MIPPPEERVKSAVWFHLPRRGWSQRYDSTSRGEGEVSGVIPPPEDYWAWVLYRKAAQMVSVASVNPGTLELKSCGTWKRQAGLVQSVSHSSQVPLFFLYRLVGLVVKASASREEDPWFESRLRRGFSGSRQTSDLKIGTPVATLPGVKGAALELVGPVSVYYDCNFCLSVAARTIVWSRSVPVSSTLVSQFLSLSPSK